jgi:nucleoside-diphosphate-sugar epimerase
MKVLITGATGFIGSHLAELLHVRGLDLKALTRPTSDTRYIKALPIEYASGSLGDVESLRTAVEGVDYIFHVAGVVAAKNRKGFFEGNQLATRNLLEAAARYNPNLTRFVHVSSLAAVGPAGDASRPVDESTPFRPITTYGESKAAAEEEVMRRKGDLPVTIVRPPAVYGPRDVGVYTFFQTVAKGFKPLIGFGPKVVSLVHVEDLVRGIAGAGLSDNTVGESYFIGSEEFYTWEQVGEIAAQALGRRMALNLRVPHAVIFAAAGVSDFLGRFRKKPPIFDFEKGKDITQPFWICSVEKAMRDFGYRQQVAIDAGVASTVDWYRAQGWL